METNRMSTKEVANFLNKSEKTVRKMAKAGKIPFTMVGSMFSFNREEIIASIKGEVPDKAPAPVVEKAPETSNGISKSKLAEINSKISLIEAESKLAKLEGSFFSPEEREKALAEIDARETEAIARENEALAEITGREVAVEVREMNVEEREAAVLLAEQRVDEYKQDIKSQDEALTKKWGGTDKISEIKADLEKRRIEVIEQKVKSEDLIQIATSVLKKYCDDRLLVIIFNEVNERVEKRRNRKGY